MEKLICKECGFENGKGKSFKEYPKKTRVCFWCGRQRLCKPPEAYCLTESDCPSKYPPSRLKAVTKSSGGSNHKSKELSPTQIEKKKLIKQNDRLWSKIVRKKANQICVVDLKSHKKLNAHHLFTRKFWSTRWDTRNGVSLCVHHHVWDFTFSAHKTPEKFRKWYITTYGETKYLFLKRESQKPITRSLAFVKYWNDKLKQEASELKIDF